MLAAVSIMRVEGSSVSKAAVISPLEHLPCWSIEAARDVADKDDEQAVSMLTAGPAVKPQKVSWRFKIKDYSTFSRMLELLEAVSRVLIFQILPFAQIVLRNSEGNGLILTAQAIENG